MMFTMLLYLTRSYFSHCKRVVKKKVICTFIIELNINTESILIIKIKKQTKK